MALRLRLRLWISIHYNRCDSNIEKMILTAISDSKSLNKKQFSFQSQWIDFHNEFISSQQFPYIAYLDSSSNHRQLHRNSALKRFRSLSNKHENNHSYNQLLLTKNTATKLTEVGIESEEKNWQQPNFFYVSVVPKCQILSVVSLDSL